MYRWNLDGLFDLIVVRRAVLVGKEFFFPGDTITISIRGAPPPEDTMGTTGGESNIGALFGFKAVVKPTFNISNFPEDVRFKNIASRVGYLYSCGDASSDAAMVKFIDSYVDEKNLCSISWEQVMESAAKENKSVEAEPMLKVSFVS